MIVNRVVGYCSKNGESLGGGGFGENLNCLWFYVMFSNFDVMYL